MRHRLISTTGHENQGTPSLTPNLYSFNKKIWEWINPKTTLKHKPKKKNNFKETTRCSYRPCKEYGREEF